MKKTLDFILESTRLKKMPRTGWVLRKVKDPETIAEHVFILALAAWALGSGRRLNLSKILKMSLAQEIGEVYAGDTTPYSHLIGKKLDLKRWPRFSFQDKEKRFKADYQTEKQALLRLVSGLAPRLRREMISLWDEFKQRKSPEGIFVSQVYWFVTYLQALQYFHQDKKFPILAWYEQMKEYITDPEILKLVHLAEKEFLPSRLRLGS